MNLPELSKKKKKHMLGVQRGLSHSTRYRTSIVLLRPLQTGPLFLLVHLAHDTVQFFTCLLLSLQLGLLLFLLLLQKLLVFGMLHLVGFLFLVVVNCGQSVEQGRHLKEEDKKNNTWSNRVKFYCREQCKVILWLNVSITKWVFFHCFCHPLHLHCTWSGLCCIINNVGTSNHDWCQFLSCSTKTLETCFTHLSLMRFSDHSGTLQVSGCLSFSLLLFGFALEGQGLLQLLGDVEPVEVPWGSYYRLERSGQMFTCWVRI